MTVDYERWSFTRESNYRALTGKNLVFFICGRLREVDSYETWSYLEFQVNPNLKNEGKRGAYYDRFTLRPTAFNSRNVAKVDLSFKTATQVSA